MASSNMIPIRLGSLVVDIDRQIDVIRAEARRQGFEAEEMKFVDGRWVLPELLLAKSNALLALTNDALSRKT